MHYTLTSEDIPFPFLESRVPSGLRSSTISPTKNQMTLKKKSEINKFSMKQNKGFPVWIVCHTCFRGLSGSWQVIIYSLKQKTLNNINMDTNNYFFFLYACTDMRVIGIKCLVYGPWTTYYYNNYHNMLFREKIYSN